MNVEHRTSNIEHRMMKSLQASPSATTRQVAPPVYKLAEYLIQNSMLDVRCSMFIFFHFLLGKNNLTLTRFRVQRTNL
jgi:hypothetical protein